MKSQTLNQVPQTIQEYQQAFEEYYQPLCNFAYSFVKDRDEAEDVVQAVFINLWKKRTSIEIQSKLSSYLFSATKNNALMVLRRQQYESKYVEHIQQRAPIIYEDDTQDAEEQLLLKEKIFQAIQTLPPKCQQIFKMSKLSGLTYKEIASDLSISVKTVENQMSKALKILREQLKYISYILFFLLLLTEILWAQEGSLLDQKVKISIKQGSVQQILDLISKEVNTPIAYSSNQISLQKQIQLIGTENTLGEYLQRIADFVPIRIVERKRKILLVPQRKKEKSPINTEHITKPRSSSSTQKYTISGYIKDSESGEVLIGATVYDSESKKGTSTNVYGFYSLTLSNPNPVLMVSYVGYASNSLPFELNKNKQQDIFLKSNTELQEVVVKASESEQIQELEQMSSNKLYSKKIKQLPVLMGEADVVKSIQLLPGVQSVNENTNGLYVRGGGPDQNLMLLDGVTIYDSNHLFGFVSIFDGDAINSIELIKGGFPAEHGGRLSSILDVRLKEGNYQSFHAGATIGLFSAKATIEGPFSKDKSSFHFSGRSSLTNNDLAKTLVDVGEDSHLDYGFYDLYGKVNFRISPKSRLFLSGYRGKDRFYTEATPYFHVSDSYGNYHEIQPFWKTDLEWNNTVGALRWNQILNAKLFANFSMYYSDYKYKFGNHYISNTLSYNNQNTNDIVLKATSDIRDVTVKADFDFYPTHGHHLKWGIGYTNHAFTPGIARFRDNKDVEMEFEFTQEIGLEKIPADDYYVYFEENRQLNKKWSVNFGLHLAGFAADQTNYLSLQPRLSTRYLLSEFSALKASFARMTQFVHLINTPWLGMPSDLWVPSSSTLKPKNANQYAVGYVHRFPELFDLNIEAYHKKFENLLTFSHNPNLWMRQRLPNWQQELERGGGKASGIEVLLERKVGQTTGWIAYTLAKTERQFESLNNGEKFPYEYDRRHDISVALTQQLSPNVSIGGVWVFATGNVTTLTIDESSSQLVIDGTNKTTLSHEDFNSDLERNNYRLPPYHRLDISINWEHSIPILNDWKGILKAGFYNLYNRENPVYINQYESNSNTDSSTEEPNILGLYEVNLLPRLPFVTYKLEF